MIRPEVAELLPDALIRLDRTGVRHTIFTFTVTRGMTVGEAFGRIDRAFAGGVNAVWVVFPNVKLVYCYTSPTTVRILSRGDELTGDPVVPGFRLPLADLFPPPDDPNPPPAANP